MMVWTPEQKTARHVGYARCSTSSQSTAYQHRALEAAACDVIFEDHGVSGAQAARPGLDEALTALEPGDVFVVFKLDRLGRSVAHLARVLEHFEANDIHFCSLTEGINTSTSGGRLIFHVFSAVAEFGRDIIRENTIAGLKAARARGSKIGRPRALSVDDALALYRAASEGNVPVADLALAAGVSEATAYRTLRQMRAQHGEHGFAL